MHLLSGLKVLGLAGLYTGVQVLVFARFLPLGPWGVTLILLGINVTATAALLVNHHRQQQPSVKQYRGNRVPLLPVFDPTIQIAHETLPFLRHGLNETTARKASEIIQKIAEVPAVAITDRERVLAYLGVGCEMHHPGDRILTEATREVIATGRHKIIETTRALNCVVKDCNCPLASAIIVPFKCQDKVAGALKLYQTEPGPPPANVVRLAIGIAQLLGMQIELAELDRKNQLLTLAKLDALHAQINPHFFFNTLNTIIMYSRTNPARTRRLLIHLADYFRQALKRHDNFTTLREELECVNTYLVLEKARFGKKLRVIRDVDPALLSQRVPVLSIQPLVENSVKHGISPKPDQGAVKISARLEGLHLILSVSDDGIGIPAENINLVLQPGYGSGNGVGLSNVHERLKGLYGEDYGLRIISCAGQGTTVYFRVPAETLVRDASPGGTAYHEPESVNS